LVEGIRDRGFRGINAADLPIERDPERIISADISQGGQIIVSAAASELSLFAVGCMGGYMYILKFQIMTDEIAATQAISVHRQKRMTRHSSITRGLHVKVELYTCNSQLYSTPHA